MKSRRKQKPILPYLLIVAGGLLLLITAALWATRTGEPDPVTSVQQPASSHDEETYPEIPRVSLEEAKAAFDANTAVFLDVPDADSYADGHIPNAVNIPLGSLSTRFEELDPNAWIITYCT